MNQSNKFNIRNSEKRKTNSQNKPFADVIQDKEVSLEKIDVLRRQFYQKETLAHKTFFYINL